MSNQPTIYLTKFTELDADGNDGEASYGLRVADNDDSTYSNLFERHEIVGQTASAIVELARGIDDRAAAIVEFAEENRDGIHIGDVFHSWDDLKAEAGSPPRP